MERAPESEDRGQKVGTEAVISKDTLLLDFPYCHFSCL